MFHFRSGERHQTRGHYLCAWAVSVKAAADGRTNPTRNQPGKSAATGTPPDIPARRAMRERNGANSEAYGSERAVTL